MIAKTQPELAEAMGVNVATLRKWIESGDFPGRPGFYPIGACFCWVVCFSPQRSEAARDDYLRELIGRMLADAETGAMK